MPVTVELTYDMGKAIGAHRLQLEATSVAQLVEALRGRFGAGADEFDALRARTAVAVNGVLLRHRAASGTQLADGDRVTFVKAAAGG